MADISRNPEERAAMQRLDAKLAGIEAELAAQRRQGERILSKDDRAKTEARRDRSRASREGRVRGRAVDTAAPGERVPLEREETRITQQTRRATEGRAQAERRVSSELRQRIRLEREAARQSRLPVPLRPGSPGSVIRAQGYAVQQAQSTGQRAAAERQAAVQANVERERLRQFVANEYAFRRALPPSRQLPAGGGTGGGAGGGLPPIGGAPPPPGGGGRPPRRDYVRDALEREKLTSSERGLAEQALRARSAEGALDSEIQQATRNIGLSSQQFRRHGALTTEFISAAARGEVTFRELGFQVGATIGKFAGWTAAATAVYGAVAAIGALGKGALEAESGVGLLSRVTTKPLAGGADQLKQKFGDLAHQFNLPINDVVQAVYGSAKVFGGDLPSALKGAESALFAVKVGELDAATATRYLTSIVNGFGLSADQLPAVFDAINQAQNRFGGSTDQMIAGVAKASGAFRLAGGDYRQLIALITTGTRLTGAPGENVGTAVARSAASVLTKQGQKRLKDAGLDPTLAYPKLLAQAFGEAQGASKERVQEIARALVPAGGQFTRIFAPLLQNRQLYERVFKELDPEKAKGSASRELGRALKQPNEQLKALVVNAERLGAALARAGAGNALFVMVRSLNAALNAAVKLVETFHRLSLGADQFVVPLAEVYGLLRLMRRFDLGGVLPKGRPGGVYEGFRGGLRGSEDYRLNKQILTGTRDQERFLEDLRAQRARETGIATFGAQRSLARRDETRALYGAGRVPIQDVAAAQRAVNSSLEQAARLSADEAAIIEQQNALRVQITEYERLRAAGLGAQVAATRAGIEYAPGTLERPVAQRAARIEELRQAGRGGGPGAAATRGGVLLGGAGAAERAAAQEAEATKQMSRLEARSAQFRGRTEQLAERMRSMGVAGQALAAASTATAGAATSALSGTAKAAGGVRTLGARLLGALGPLDILLLSLVALYESYHHITQQLESSERQIERLTAPSASPDVIARRAQQELGQHSAFERAQSAFANAYNFLRGPDLPGGLHVPLPRAQSPDQAQDEAARHAQAEARSLKGAQRRGRLLPLQDIATNYRRRAAQAQNDAQSLAAVDKEIEEIRNGYAYSFGGKAAKQAAREALAAAQARRRDLLAASDDLDKVQQAISSITDAKGLQTFAKDTGGRFGLEGGTKGNFRRASLAIAQARELVANRRISPAEGLQAIQELQQDAQRAAEDQLNRLLPYARSPQEAGRLRSTYVSRLRQVLVGGTQRRVQSLSNTVRDRQKQINALQKSLDQAPDPNQPRADQQQAVAGEAKKRDQLRKLKGAQGQDRETLRKLRAQLGVSRQEFEAIRREQQRAQFEAEQAVYDARTELSSARIADPLQQIRVQLSRNEQRLGAIAREYGRGSQQYIQALTKSAQLRAQLVQQEIQRYQARQELAQAQFSIGTTQGQQLQFAVNQAQQFASYVQGLGKRADPTTMLQAFTALANARAQLAEFLRQQAQELISAQSEYRQSLTEDPVRQAGLRFREQQQLLRFARTPGERLRAQAQINNARREYRQTRQREAFDEIEFEADIGRISKDAELRRLQMLLRTLKGNRDLRREIQRRIYQLQHDDTNLADLDVGSIKLPTIYDVRRAVAGGLSSTRHVQITNQPRVNVTVNDPRAAGAVADAIDGTLATSTRSAMRSVGLSP